MPQAEQQRLFFALWPDDVLRQRLVELLNGEQFRNAAGRTVAARNLHITLRYLGAVSPSEQECAERVATEIDGHGFSIELNRVGYWTAPRVAWLGTDKVPPSLQRLVEALETGLRRCGLPPETRPYQPHLTFLRKARSEGLPSVIEPLLWRVDGFVLMRSVPVTGGVHYEVVRCWSLDGEKGGVQCMDD